MCGITGWYSKCHQKQDKRTLKKMTKSLKYRGPDQKGYFIKDNIMLGHRRLSIIDLKNGIQPMTRDGYTIVYNGEIYNTEELRNMLKQKYEFKTTSDTEVLLIGYIEYKEKILDMIEGIYAFAIYKDDKLFLARDRVGVKPLFYTKIKDNFIFGSEIKALLKNNLIDFKVSNYDFDKRITGTIYVREP
jgi:asparagine synthase (glutamine-hydrolysing)